MADNLVKSHVQMPRFVLKKFENSCHELYYYDVKGDVVKRGHAKSLNREYGYYSKEVETLFCEHIEGPFGSVLNFISETDFSAPVDIPPCIKDSIWKYIHALIARGPATVQMVNRSSVYFRFLSKVEKHDYTATEVFHLAQDNNPLSHISLRSW